MPAPRLRSNHSFDRDTLARDGTRKKIYIYKIYIYIYKREKRG